MDKKKGFSVFIQSAAGGLNEQIYELFFAFVREKLKGNDRFWTAAMAISHNGVSPLLFAAGVYMYKSSIHSMNIG